MSNGGQQQIKRHKSIYFCNKLSTYLWWLILLVISTTQLEWTSFQLVQQLIQQQQQQQKMLSKTTLTNSIERQQITTENELCYICACYVFVTVAPFAIAMLLCNAKRREKETMLWYIINTIKPWILTSQL